MRVCVRASGRCSVSGRYEIPLGPKSLGLTSHNARIKMRFDLDGLLGELIEGILPSTPLCTAVDVDYCADHFQIGGGPHAECLNDPANVVLVLGQEILTPRRDTF